MTARMTILAFLACCAAACRGAPAAAGAVNADSLLQAYSARISRHNQFTARFRQSRHLSMFDAPLVSEGTIVFRAPGDVRLHYTSPFESVILFSGGTFSKYFVENGVWTHQPSLEIVTKAITREMTRWLSADFAADFPYTAHASAADLRRVVLVPRNAVAKAVFTSIELYFSPTAEYIQKVKLVEGSGDSTVIVHEAPAFGPVDPALFRRPGAPAER